MPAPSSGGSRVSPQSPVLKHETSNSQTEYKPLVDESHELPTAIKLEPGVQHGQVIFTQHTTPTPFTVESTPPVPEARIDTSLQSHFSPITPSQTSDGKSSQKRGKSKKRLKRH